MGDLDLRNLFEKLFYYRNLEKTRSTILKQLQELEVLTPELEASVKDAESVTELDDLYRPYRPKKRTRATQAREKGLEPLSKIIMNGTENPVEAAQEFIDENNGVEDKEQALSGARDIIAEIISDDAVARNKLRSLIMQKGFLVTRAVEEETQSPYQMYYQFSQAVKDIRSHQILAINRGEKDKYLHVKLEVPAEDAFSLIAENYLEGSSVNEVCINQIEEAIRESYKRLLFPSLEREIRNELTQKAEEQALNVFRDNLKNLLMTPPVHGKQILGLDPGYRTGCKLACIDETGRFLETSVIFPLQPYNQKEKAAEVVMSLLQRYKLNAIAIGNGTGGRESEEFIAETLASYNEPAEYTVVNEAGASVYSASKLASEEFPELDEAGRSAVSIARRVQDPLAELVKIEPRSIGVGQYQHDINQGRLEEVLDGVVEACVNQVGVDLNTASKVLLSRVAGISKPVAYNIVAYREENGVFKNREELKFVPRLGPATFKQCAGFLRIPGAENYLDRSAVHPESYDIAFRLIDKLGLAPSDLGKPEAIPGVDIAGLAGELDVGEYTLRDIIEEFKRPGRDPREDLPATVFKKDVLKIEDLKDGMELTGVIRNVVDFGAFVDIGVHQDGLIHISELAEKYVRHPSEVVKVGDTLKVKVLSVDIERRRISLSSKI